MLRITPLATPDGSGKLYSIPSTNPFASTSTTIRKEIYSYGLRNPFTFDIDPLTGKVYVGIPGWNTWETVVNSTLPVNLGWPNYEGPAVGNPENLASYTEPLFWYPHSGIEPITGNTAGLEAISAGSFYNGTVYPSQFQGGYFFGDFGIGQIQVLLSADKAAAPIDPVVGVPKSQVQTIVSGLSNAPINMHDWNGKLYFFDLSGGFWVLNYQ
jgi:glucose/arabinose dehydrogenase